MKLIIIALLLIPCVSKAQKVVKMVNSSDYTFTNNHRGSQNEDLVLVINKGAGTISGTVLIRQSVDGKLFYERTQKLTNERRQVVDANTMMYPYNQIIVRSRGVSVLYVSPVMLPKR